MNNAHIHNTTIAYEETGTGDPLLLIHGGMISHKEWQPQIAAWSPHFRLIMPDVRGHGASGRDGTPYSIKQWAGDMAALLDTLGIAQAFVCGHSMGGMVAQQLATDYPQKVRALVIAESNYGTRNDPMMRIAGDLSVGLFKMLGPKTAAKIATAPLTGTPEVRQMLEAEMAHHTDNPANMYAILDAMNAYDGRTNLPRIQCPTLVISGGNFKLGHKQGQHMGATIPSARWMTIANAGHGVNWDNAPDFNEAVLAFFRQHSA
jgi:3-oxoadipate enol-lactonase